MDKRYEPAAIRSLFDEMAATYGVVNLIASFGFARRWRHQAIRGLPLNEGSHVFDLMSGMSELCHSLSTHVTQTIRVTGIDLSPEMVRRARRDWPFPSEILVADVLAWDFESACADAVISSFGLKTFDPDQQKHLARRVAALLRPGGVFSFVEISVPPSRLLRWPYMFYLKFVIPWVGRIFLGNPANYRMLGVFTEEFGNCRQFAEALREFGLEVAEVRYFFGCATGVRGVKPMTRA